MGGDHNKEDSLISDINVTPFVDVMLVLLVIFMVATPLMFNGIELSLPKTEESNVVKMSRKQVILSLTKENELYLGPNKVVKKNLINEIKRLLKETNNKIVFLRADTMIEYGKVATIMSYLKAYNINNIALITEIEK